MLPIKVIDLDQVPATVSSQSLSPRVAESNKYEDSIRQQHPAKAMDASRNNKKTKKKRGSLCAKLNRVNDVYPMDDQGNPLFNFLPLKNTKMITFCDSNVKRSRKKSAVICNSRKTTSDSDAVNSAEVIIDFSSGANKVFQSPDINSKSFKNNGTVTGINANLGHLAKGSANFDPEKVKDSALNTKITNPVEKPSVSNPMNQFINNRNEIATFVGNCLDPKYRLFLLKEKYKSLLGTESNVNASDSEVLKKKLPYEPNITYLASLKTKLDSLKPLVSALQSSSDANSDFTPNENLSHPFDEVKTRSNVILKNLSERKLAAKKTSTMDDVGYQKNQKLSELRNKFLNGSCLKNTTDKSNQDKAISKDCLKSKKEDRTQNLLISSVHRNKLLLGNLTSEKPLDLSVKRQFNNQDIAIDTNQDKKKQESLKTLFHKNKQMVSAGLLENLAAKNIPNNSNDDIIILKEHIKSRMGVKGQFNNEDTVIGTKEKKGQHKKHIKLGVGVKGQFNNEDTVIGTKEKKRLKNPLHKKELYSKEALSVQGQDKLSQLFDERLYPKPGLKDRLSECCKLVMDDLQKNGDNLGIKLICSELSSNSTAQSIASNIFENNPKERFSINPLMAAVPEQLKIHFQTQPNPQLRSPSILEEGYMQILEKDYISSWILKASCILEESYAQNSKMDPVSSLLLIVVVILIVIHKQILIQNQASRILMEKQKYNFKKDEVSYLQLKASWSWEERRKQILKIVQSSSLLNRASSILKKRDKIVNLQLESSNILEERQKHNFKMVQVLNLLRKALSFIEQNRKESFEIGHVSNNKPLQSSSSMPLPSVNSKPSNIFTHDHGNDHPAFCTTASETINKGMIKNSSQSINQNKFCSSIALKRQCENANTIAKRLRVNPKPFQKTFSGHLDAAYESSQLPTLPSLTLNPMLKHNISTKASKIQLNSCADVSLISPITLVNSNTLQLITSVASEAEKNEMPSHCNLRSTMPTYNAVKKQNSACSKVARKKRKKLSSNPFQDSHSSSKVFLPVMLVKPVPDIQCFSKNSLLSNDHNQDGLHSERVSTEQFIVCSKTSTQHNYLQAKTVLEKEQNQFLNQVNTDEFFRQKTIAENSLTLNPLFTKEWLPNESNPSKASCSHVSGLNSSSPNSNGGSNFKNVESNKSQASHLVLRAKSILSRSCSFQETAGGSLNPNCESDLELQNDTNIKSNAHSDGIQSENVSDSLQNTDANSPCSVFKNKVNVCDGKEKHLIVRLERLPQAILNCLSYNLCGDGEQASNNECVLPNKIPENNYGAQSNKQCKKPVKRKQSSVVHKVAKKQRVIENCELKDIQTSDNMDCSNEMNVNNLAVLEDFGHSLSSSNGQNICIDHPNLEIKENGTNKTKHLDYCINSEDISLSDESDELPEFIKKSNLKFQLNQLRCRIAAINDALEVLRIKHDYAHKIVTTSNANTNQIAIANHENADQTAVSSHENEGQTISSSYEITDNIACTSQENIHPVTSLIHKNAHQEASALKNLRVMLFKLPYLPKKPTIVLNKLPECIYEKHMKGKPIMVSNIIPMIKNICINAVCEVDTDHDNESVSDNYENSLQIANDHRELRMVLFQSPCLSKELKVDLFKLPDCIFDKHKKGKPIMLSNILPTISKVESLNDEDPLQMCNMIFKTESV